MGSLHLYLAAAPAVDDHWRSSRRFPANSGSRWQLRWWRRDRGCHHPAEAPEDKQVRARGRGIFIAGGLIWFNWIYHRTEPKFLTPLINRIAPFFPAAGRLPDQAGGHADHRRRRRNSGRRKTAWIRGAGLGDWRPMAKPFSDIGLVGLAVMGQNLALNIADHGFQISVYNRTTEKTDKFVADNPHTPGRRRRDEDARGIRGARSRSRGRSSSLSRQGRGPTPSSTA